VPPVEFCFPRTSSKSADQYIVVVGIKSASSSNEIATTRRAFFFEGGGLGALYARTTIEIVDARRRIATSWTLGAVSNPESRSPDRLTRCGMMDRTITAASQKKLWRVLLLFVE